MSAHYFSSTMLYHIYTESGISREDSPTTRIRKAIPFAMMYSYPHSKHTKYTKKLTKKELVIYKKHYHIDLTVETVLYSYTYERCLDLQYVSPYTYVELYLIGEKVYEEMVEEKCECSCFECK